MDWLFAEGAQVVWLSTDSATRAEAFYKSAGWRCVGQEESGKIRYEMARQEWSTQMKDIRLRGYRSADLQGRLAVFDTNVPAFFRQHEREECRAFMRALPGPYFVLENHEGEVVGCGGYAVVAEDERADLCWGMIRADLQLPGFIGAKCGG